MWKKKMSIFCGIVKHVGLVSRVNSTITHRSPNSTGIIYKRLNILGWRTNHFFPHFSCGSIITILLNSTTCFVVNAFIQQRALDRKISFNRILFPKWPRLEITLNTPTHTRFNLFCFHFLSFELRRFLSREQNSPETIRKSKHNKEN